MFHLSCYLNHFLFFSFFPTQTCPLVDDSTFCLPPSSPKEGDGSGGTESRDSHHVNGCVHASDHGDGGVVNSCGEGVDGSSNGRAGDSDCKSRRSKTGKVSAMKSDKSKRLKQKKKEQLSGVSQRKRGGEETKGNTQGEYVYVGSADCFGFFLLFFFVKSTITIHVVSSKN